jgi:hypothetical protein
MSGERKSLKTKPRSESSPAVRFSRPPSFTDVQSHPLHGELKRQGNSFTFKGKNVRTLFTHQ